MLAAWLLATPSAAAWQTMMIVLKQIPFETSIPRQLLVQFPTISDISINCSGGVQVYAVIAMKPWHEGEARQAILAALASKS